MVSKGEGFQVLWPIYFDKNLTRGQGRRVSRAQAVASPNLEDITKAVKGLKMKYRVEAESTHPSRPWKACGRVVVQADIEKSKLIKWVAKRLK